MKDRQRERERETLSNNKNERACLEKYPSIRERVKSEDFCGKLPFFVSKNL